MMRHLSNAILGGLFVLALGLAPSGCGGPEGDAGIETVRNEYWYFGGWTSIPGKTLVDSPALAKGAGTTLTAFGLGNDGQIWTTAQDGTGHWTGTWTALPGGTFASRPAAAVIDLTSGQLVNHFAIVAMRSDGKYYVRVQDQTGSSVVSDWAPLRYWLNSQFHDLFWSSAPAMTFVPPGSLHTARLVIAGTTSGGTIGSHAHYFFNDRYSIDNFGSMPTEPFSLPLPADTAPALAFVPLQSDSQSYLAMAWGVEGASGLNYKMIWLKEASSHQGVWRGPVQAVPNAAFNSGPALAGTNQGQFGREVTLYGVGLDSRLYVANDPASGNFAPVSTQIVGSNPSALGVGGMVNVTALVNGVPYLNRDRYYAYTTWPFDNGSSWGYQGAGDWAWGEYKGGCAATEWAMGVSVDGTGRGHSVRCASADTTTTNTANLHTLDVSAGNDGYGNHSLGYDWDAGFYKGECAGAEAVVGLSQATSGGALKHVRCAPVGAFGTNCRPLLFGAGDNRESPGDSAEWAYQYRKNQCRQGSAIAGVSRSTDTGAAHAILCCDFASL